MGRIRDLTFHGHTGHGSLAARLEAVFGREAGATGPLSHCSAWHCRMGETGFFDVHKMKVCVERRSILPCELLRAQKASNSRLPK